MSTVTANNPDPARFEGSIRAFENWDRKNAPPQNAVLFVGSSSIRLWKTAESFPSLPVMNRGFGGAHTSDVNHFVDRIVLKYKPRKIVFYCGDNDIAGGKTSSQVASDIQAFIERVNNKRPATEIYYIPIKPSTARWNLWAEMSEVNDQIKNLAKQNSQVHFVDIISPMLGDDGKPRKELFLDDGLHMNDRGYEIWNKAVADALKD